MGDQRGACRHGQHHSTPCTAPVAINPLRQFSDLPGTHCRNRGREKGVRVGRNPRSQEAESQHPSQRRLRLWPLPKPLLSLHSPPENIERKFTVQGGPCRRISSSLGCLPSVALPSHLTDESRHCCPEKTGDHERLPSHSSSLPAGLCDPWFSNIPAPSRILQTTLDPSRAHLPGVTCCSGFPPPRPQSQEMGLEDAGFSPMPSL